MIDLLAQAADSTIPTWLGPTSAVGGLGVGISFMAWYAWHTTRHVIPALVKDSRDSNERLAMAFVAEAKGVRETAVQESRLDREEFKEALDKIVAHCAEENDKVYQRYSGTLHKP